MPPWFIVGLGAAAVALWLSITGGAKGRSSGDSDAGGDASGLERSGSGAAEGEYVIPGDPLRLPGQQPDQQTQQTQPEASWGGSDYSDVYTDPGPSGPPYYLGPTPDMPTGDYVPWPPGGWNPSAPTVGDPGSSAPLGGGSGTSPQHPILMPEE